MTEIKNQSENIKNLNKMKKKKSITLIRVIDYRLLFLRGKAQQLLT